MITYEAAVTKDGNKKIGDFAFKGLSTDTKPTEAFDGMEIKNGSSFFEINTQKVKFYDAENVAWV